MLAIAPSGNLGYITHGATFNGVAVMNTATNTVFTNIPIPVDVTIAAAVTPNSAFVYVTCLSFTTGPKLAVIDTATNSLVTLVPLPATFPPAVAITPNGAFAYVANNGGGICCVPPGPSSVSVIDTSSNTQIASVSVGSPTAIGVTPDGAFVYSVDGLANNVAVISTATNTVVTTVPVGIFPQSIAFGTLQPEPPPEPEPDPLDSLFTQVQVLITGGTVTQDQGAGLMDKLGQIKAKIDAGQTGSACNQSDAFINQVNALLNNGSLTPSQALGLIDTANALKTKLGC